MHVVLVAGVVEAAEKVRQKQKEGFQNLFPNLNSVPQSKSYGRQVTLQA